MKRPPARPNLPSRQSDNSKRRLASTPNPELIDRLLATAHYVGSPKHKRQPHLFGLPPYAGERGDATLCDDHAGFMPENMNSVPQMIRRGLLAELLTQDGRILWTLGNNGWVYECRLTNIGQAEYHGYPIRSSEPICEPVYRRFVEWATRSGSEDDKAAARQCKALYGFR